MGEIELIARGLAYRDGRILLAHKKGEMNTFLPGGHVIYGESTINALIREFKEEMGAGVEIGEFIGALEHKYVGREEDEHHELNLIFGVDFNGEAVSRESHLEFSWVRVEKLADAVLLPEVLSTMIELWLSDHRAVYYSSG